MLDSKNIKVQQILNYMRCIGQLYAMYREINNKQIQIQKIENQQANTRRKIKTYPLNSSVVIDASKSQQ